MNAAKIMATLAATRVTPRPIANRPIEDSPFDRQQPALPVPPLHGNGFHATPLASPVPGTLRVRRGFCNRCGKEFKSRSRDGRQLHEAQSAEELTTIQAKTTTIQAKTTTIRDGTRKQSRDRDSAPPFHNFVTTTSSRWSPAARSPVHPPDVMAGGERSAANWRTSTSGLVRPIRGPRSGVRRKSQERR